MEMRTLTPFALGAALLAAFSGSALAAGDAAKGKQVFEQCATCHMVGPGAATLIGPELNGIVGRKAASIANYPMYSDGMRTLGELGVVWTEENLDKWLASPKALLPNTYMGMFPGLAEASDRANVIAYLKTFSQ
jgi:cytochrome c